MLRNLFLSCTLFLLLSDFHAQELRPIWQIGAADNKCTEFALAPDRYRAFIENDFGWEDKYYLIGTSKASENWPYVLPGTSDKWAGTWGTSGWRSHTLNILFGIEGEPPSGDYTLVIDLLDCHAEDPPLVKITVNGSAWKFQLTPFTQSVQPDSLTRAGSEKLIRIALPHGLLVPGGNEIRITTLQGSWLVFDQVRLEGPAKTQLKQNRLAFLRNVEPAGYEIEIEGKACQPLLVDVEHLSGLPELKVLLDGKEIFRETLESGRYTFEAPMPAVDHRISSDYSILVEDGVIASGMIERAPFPTTTKADYIDTRIGTAHSRWMIAPGPWMPFSMVKISPDNQNGGWQAGYEPTFESIGGFSHIHEWTMAGLLTMPVNGTLQLEVGDEKDPDSGYRSRIDKSGEQAGIGYYGVHLSDYGIDAELTATTRCSFQRYTFPRDREANRILVDLVIPAEYHYEAREVHARQTDAHRLEGYSKQVSPNTWAGGVTQEYTVHFVMEFDQPITRMDTWTGNGIVRNTFSLEEKDVSDAGLVLYFDTGQNPVVQLRTGISYVSIENARLNLETEVTDPFGWDFESVREAQVNAWNALFDRVEITTPDRREKMRFYNNFYRALCSRNTFSDVNGQWVDAEERIRKLEDPDSPALGCDAFWNTFWNLNQFWNLVTPEWSARWVQSQLAMYDAHGWLAKGPAGMEYIPVMVAEHEIPLIVGAYQMGIRDFDAEKALQAAVRMQTTLPVEIGGGFAGNRDLEAYLEHNYVPYDAGRFSNSLEYAFDDWCVGQFARSLGKDSLADLFTGRGANWRNVIDPVTGYARMKDKSGEWLADFDPYQSGANHHYVEGNAWQLTYFVPQDVQGLVDMIGRERFAERLDWGFRESEKTRFNGLNDQYWNYPVMQGNQQSMHFAFLFNWAGKPWLTQKWSRSILDRYYGYGVANAYLGDEDQGQMSAWFLMAALGLFQTDGGCRTNPVYEIGSPLYEKVVVDLGEQFGRGKTFTIEAKNASRLNKYVQSATLNGKPLNHFSFPAHELLNGGKLVLEMGKVPNPDWGK